MPGQDHPHATMRKWRWAKLSRLTHSAYRSYPRCLAISSHVASPPSSRFAPHSRAPPSNPDSIAPHRSGGATQWVRSTKICKRGNYCTKLPYRVQSKWAKCHDRRGTTLEGLTAQHHVSPTTTLYIRKHTKQITGQAHDQKRKRKKVPRISIEDALLSI